MTLGATERVAGELAGPEVQRRDSRPGTIGLDLGSTTEAASFVPDSRRHRDFRHLRQKRTTSLAYSAEVFPSISQTRRALMKACL
jgi:hypothetical protein